MTHLKFLFALSVMTMAAAGCGSTDEDGPGAGGAGGSGGASGSGGNSGTSGASGASGTGGASGSSGSGGTSGAGGASGSGGSSGAPCIQPTGRWNVVYSSGGAPPESDVIDIDAKGAVKFERKAPQDGCTPGGAGKVTKNEGSIDAKCVLTASWAANYCYSGEQQFLTRELSLLFVGNASADGTMTLTRWSNTSSKFAESFGAKATSLP